ncbi:uncharacterized protein LOC143562108 [Bidens hawaiensis]|uniref:uncharacterized protein LOC143562108 n=1 Tax=Bidens hawaiensis TaxID=980011 RepID=UPI004049E8EC
MNPTKSHLGLFHHHLDPTGKSQPLIFNNQNQPEIVKKPQSPPPPPPLDFCLPEFDYDEDSGSPTSSDGTNPNPQIINPNPHISSQFYTFNTESHSLMIRCILESRLATPDEIRAATPAPVLASWKSVWKDRNEDTAYLTAWKRIQDKLTAHSGQHGNEFLCFKNNLNNQFVSHTSQWQDIVMSFHGDADLKHLGVKETIERIKQVWTVGAKFYGIPESFIRACVSACSVCLNGSGLGRSKRRRFEYTESFDVPAKQVPCKLKQLASKHKVVLCIRQKYIRYKPFMAEVKDYACHRAGEPVKKSRVLKREPYASKRCGCGFRIRAIVPICNYNEKDKSFVYQEEGVAVFKLYAVHTGHEPGPLDGNARIMHRVVGHKGGFLMDQDFVYGTGDENDMQNSVLLQINELKNEVGLLEGRVLKIPPEVLGSVSRELFDVLNRVRNLGEYGSKPGLLLENELVDWNVGQSTDLMEDDDDGFDPTLGDVGSWDQINGDKCNGFDCEDSKLIKRVTNDETETDPLIGLQVDSFYPDNHKWYDPPCGLGPGMDCGEIV